MIKRMKLPITVYIDEAGRWPIAWPVMVGLVLGDKHTDRSHYQDSKILTTKRREQLADQIKSDSSIVRSTGSASAKEIDRNGIIRALRWATIRWLYSLIKKISNGPQLQWRWWYYIKLLNIIQSWLNVQLIIDGNHMFWLDINLWISVQTIIKWDRDIPQISAASIIAKTTRDNLMIRFSIKYLWYELDRHMWYGTKKHYEAIVKLGLCEIHRKKRIKLKN